MIDANAALMYEYIIKAKLVHCVHVDGNLYFYENVYVRNVRRVFQKSVAFRVK